MRLPARTAMYIAGPLGGAGSCGGAICKERCSLSHHSGEVNPKVVRPFDKHRRVAVMMRVWLMAWTKEAMPKGARPTRLLAAATSTYSHSCPTNHGAVVKITRPALPEELRSPQEYSFDRRYFPIMIIRGASCRFTLSGTGSSI